MSPLVHQLGPTRRVHRVPVTPVVIDLLDGCRLQLIPAIGGPGALLATVQGTLLYCLTGVGLRRLLATYTGITQQLTGARVLQSFRQRTAEMRPAALALLLRDTPYAEDFQAHLEAAVIKHLAMRTRPLNVRSAVGETTAGLAAAHRPLADALARQVADAVSTFGLGTFHNVPAWGYRNARDLAAASIHRLGRAVDTHQVVQMLDAGGASLTSLRQDYVARRDLVQRERHGGNVRVDHVKVDGITVFYPTGILTPAQALADYTTQRRHRPRGRLPIPPPATGRFCPCPYCTPSTQFTAANVTATP